MIFAHVFIGLIIASIINPRFLTSTRFAVSKQKVLIWSAAILGSIFPDIDFIFVFLFGNTDLHRQILTHSLLPYLLLLGIGSAFIIYKKIDKLYLNMLMAFVFGVMFHLVADMVANPVYLFQPILNNGYAIMPSNFAEGTSLFAYVFSKYMLIELSIITLGMILLIKSFKSYKKEFRFMLATIAIIQVVVIAALIPFL